MWPSHAMREKERINTRSIETMWDRNMPRQSAGSRRCILTLASWLFRKFLLHSLPVGMSDVEPPLLEPATPEPLSSDLSDWFGKQGSKEEEVPSTAFLHHSDRELSSELEPEDLQSECGSILPGRKPAYPETLNLYTNMEGDDIAILKRIWRRYQDDLTEPYYEKKPEFSDSDFDDFYSIACKVVNAMVAEYKVPMILDQATISNTNHVGHPPHADNIQFDSVWWKGKKIPKQDEVQAAREGAYVLWRNEKTSYRSYSCSVSLCDPDGYQGGAVQFFRGFGIKEGTERRVFMQPLLSADAFAVDYTISPRFAGEENKNIHAVTGVTSGFRLVLLVWTRPPEVRVPESQATVCYFRPGTGLGVWLTTADILRHLSRLCA
eukprot:s75_g22.t1